MTTLMYLSFIICVFFLSVSVLFTIIILSIRSLFGDFNKYNRLYVFATPITYTGIFFGIAFTILGFWGKTWPTASGPKILIGLYIAIIIIDVFHQGCWRSASVHFKNEKTKEKFYTGAAAHVMKHKRNEMGYFMNDGPCPVCGKDAIGVEPYRFYCPYCKLTAEITEDDVKQWKS